MIGVFKLAGGAIGKVTQTYASMRGAASRDLRVTLHGTRGSIEDDRLFSLDWFPGESDRRSPAARPGADAAARAGGVSHEATSRTSSTASWRGATRQLDGREGARTVAACLAAIELAASGQPVRPVRF